MNDTKPVNPEPGTELPIEQAAEVGGGDGTQSCPTSATVVIGPITSNGPTVSDALIGVYEGAVDTTSHVLERVLGSAKL
jgi:hypothetical protein